MVIVDINKLRTLLKFDGVDNTNFTDDELDILVNNKLLELEGLTGANLYPKDKTKIISRFKGRLIELNDYPILQIVDVFINDHPIKSCHYNVNYDLGIIYFGKYIHGSVKVQYTAGFSDIDFEYLVLPLLKDMVAYTITFGKTNQNLGGWAYLASSLKEGDVSVNFSNGATGDGVYGYNGSINNKINELKQKYGCRARVRLI